MNNDVFISYRRGNGYSNAKLIADRLYLDFGLRSFLDHEQIKAEQFDKRLIEAIEDAPNFILILSPNSLDRCVNTDDWVRMEIETAMRLKKRIIPVACDGFKWPKSKNAQLPEGVKGLEHLQHVKLVQEYLPASIEKIVSFMDGLSFPYSLPFSSVEFLKVLYDRYRNDIQSIDLALHSGSVWYSTPNKAEILNTLAESGIELRVIVNPKRSIECICRHMRQPRCIYIDFDENIVNWQRFSEDFGGKLKVRVSEIPILHRLLLVRMKNNIGAVNVKYYTYGNYIPEKDLRRVFVSPSEEAKLYLNEFEYLWERASEEDK